MNTEGEIQLRRMVLGLPFDLQSPTGESPARILVPAVVCKRPFTTHLFQPCLKARCPCVCTKLSEFCDGLPWLYSASRAHFCVYKSDCLSLLPPGRTKVLHFPCIPSTEHRGGGHPAGAQQEHHTDSSIQSYAAELPGTGAQLVRD